MFTGRLTREPAYKAKGFDKTSIIAFTLAVNNGFGDTEKTLFIDCSAYGSLADKLSTELYKGVKVIVEGVLYTYDSQYGNNKLALTLKDCEIVQHTSAYLKKNNNILKDIEKRTDEVIKEASEFANNDTNKFNKKSKAVSWDEIEKSLAVEKENKYGLDEDGDGFLVCSEDDIELPFD